MFSWGSETMCHCAALPIHWRPRLQLSRISQAGQQLLRTSSRGVPEARVNTESCSGFRCSRRRETTHQKHADHESSRQVRLPHTS